MKAQLIVVAMVVGALARGAEAQSADLVKDSPFTATFTSTTNSKGVVKVDTLEVARASDGSIYARSSYDGGKDVSIRLWDVPHGRVYSTGLYFKFENKQLVPVSTEDERAAVGRRQHAQDRQTKTELYHTISLGIKTEDGMTLYGERVNFTRNDGLVGQNEQWFTDFGLAVLTIHSDSGGTESTTKMTGLQLGEPDAKLFKVPSGMPERGALPLIGCNGDVPAPCGVLPQDVRKPGVHTGTAGSADSWSQVGQPELGRPLPGPH